MNPRSWFVCGAVLAALGVLNGAYAAHGLADALVERYEALELDAMQLIPTRLQQYETGVRYQMYHALGLMLLGIIAVRRPSPLWMLAGFGFIAGIHIFSGMLYILVLTNQTKLGMFVPIGGVSFVVGWLALACGSWGCLNETTAAALPDRTGPTEHATVDLAKTVELNADKL